jgi:plasmid maintenance system antidote protein VapI
MSNDFSPDWVSPPGDTIKDILAERNMSESEFSALIGLSGEETNNLLSGNAMITIAMARKLERVFGASVEFWMARDYRYWQSKNFAFPNETHAINTPTAMMQLGLFAEEMTGGPA